MGMQLTYYLFSPLLHYFQAKKKYCNIIIFTGSFIVFVLSLQGKIESAWGYSLLPGMIWIFILGIYMHIDGKNEKILLFSIYLLVLALFLYMGITGKWVSGQNKEILLGVILGLPLIYFLKTFPRNKIDDFLGNISYGVYLDHFTIKNIIQNITGHQPCDFYEWTVFIGLSVIGAIFSYFLVEYPVKKLNQHKKNQK